MSREVYEPAEDTELLLAALRDLALAGRRVLEVGSGSGVVIEEASRYGAEVVAVDVNPHACEATRARIGGRVVRGDLMGALRGRVDEEPASEPSTGPTRRARWSGFDVVLFNAPYLPSSAEERVEGWLDHAFHGGEGGVETSIRFVRDLPRVLAPLGRALLVVSSRADLPRLEEEIAAVGLRVERGPSRRYFFEEVAVWSISRQA